MLIIHKHYCTHVNNMNNAQAQLTAVVENVVTKSQRALWATVTDHCRRLHDSTIGRFSRWWASPGSHCCTHYYAEYRGSFCTHLCRCHEVAVMYCISYTFYGVLILFLIGGVISLIVALAGGFAQ